jgi:VIT1/CCC1 family predicted Fe2+/Mn2+ transporter
MKFELGLEEPDPKRAITSASTIAFSYIAGGFVPLLPYILTNNTANGLKMSAVLTLAALGIFGFAKGRFTGTSPLRGGVQTMVIGGLAAGAAFLLAKWIS